MSDKYYEVWFHQENGFASTNYAIKAFKSGIKAEFYAKMMNKEDKDAMYTVCKREFNDEEIDRMLKQGILMSDEEIYKKINEIIEEETIQKQNQEITACYDTLITIHELCDAVLNYDFKNVNDKVDFCHMLNEMDNKDLAFLKECFEAIRDNDLKTMTSLTLECKYGDVE